MEVADWSKMQRKLEINGPGPGDGATLVLADKSVQLLLLAASLLCWVKIRTLPSTAETSSCTTAGDKCESSSDFQPTVLMFAPPNGHTPRQYFSTQPAFVLFFLFLRQQIIVSLSF